MKAGGFVDLICMCKVNMVGAIVDPICICRGYMVGGIVDPICICCGKKTTNIQNYMYSYKNIFRIHMEGAALIQYHIRKWILPLRQLTERWRVKLYALLWLMDTVWNPQAVKEVKVCYHLYSFNIVYIFSMLIV